MAPDFANETMLTAQIPQALAKIIAGAPDRRQQLIQNVEKLERHTAGECAPAERGPVHSGGDRRSRPLIRNNHTQRQAAGQGLSRHHDVR